MSQQNSRWTKMKLRIEVLERRCVPATITPTTFADGGPGSGSLRDAALQFNADSGTADDTIQLLPGTYSLTIRNVGNRHETAGLTGDLNLNQTRHRWIIQGAGPSTIIDASQLQDRVFQIVNPGTQVVFQDLVIQGGLAQDNGADGAVAGTTDALGGGILNNSGNITLDNVVVQNNVARGGDAPDTMVAGYSASGGGLYSVGGALTLAGATIANNQATGGRGLNDSYGNGPRGGYAMGGGLFAERSSIEIADSQITNDRAVGGHGGDYGMTTGTVRGGPGGWGEGGGLYVGGGALTIATIATSTIASNQAMGGDGGLGTGQNGASQGGGLYIAAARSTITNSTLSSNSSNSDNPDHYSGGGGLYNEYGSLAVSNSILSGNSADFGWGGGIYNYGTLAVTNSTLSSNYGEAGGGISNGGILGLRGTLTVSNSTLSGNFGAAIGNSYGTLTVSNSTLSDNFGAAIVNSYGTLTVSNSTLSDNSRGLYVYSAPPPMLLNTLIAGNFDGTTRDDVFGPLDPRGSFNLIGDGTGMTGLSNGVNGNQVGSASAPIDPLFGTLQDNGGPTQTIALLPGSPALDAGDPGQLGTADQRGVIRTGGVNIGAYQASATAFRVGAPDTVQSGAPFDESVTAVDPFRQVAVGYLGTVTFSATDPDPGVVLPADYSFQPGDGGQVAFPGGVTLITPGDQTLTVMDTTDNTITGSALITVGSTALGTGSHSLEGQPPPSRSQGSAPPTSERSHPEVVAGDHWFASVSARDLRFALFPPIAHAPAGGDWWARDSGWGADEPLFT
jgi:hypothetical protein